jgi:hypothetical protein
LHQLHQAQLI